MIFRASSLGKLMTTSRSKTDVLSVTAKSYIKQVAKQNYFGYRNQISSRYIDKGQQQEQDSIDLINTVRMESYTKHIGRVTKDYMSGECDILTADTIIDTKTSWSLDTWQMRAYMMLYDKPQAEVIYCLVTTDPDLLSSFDDHELHQVDHIPADKRITVLKYDRDILLEAEIMERLQLCSEYYDNYMQQLNNK